MCATVDGNSKLRLRKPLRVGTWNVRTLLSTGAARTLIAEIEKAGVSIMGLQEVRWPDAGETVVADYTILWSGPQEGSPRQAGVGLMLSKKASAAMTNWHPISDRLLLAKISHLRQSHHHRCVCTYK
jgi:hypothetical protein